MIARIWTARATPTNADAYRDHFDHAAAPAMRQLEGHAGAELLTLNRGDEVEIVVITRWRSLEAIASFAGEDVESAVVAPEAQQLLSSWDRRVRHFTVTSMTGLDPLAEG
jgi:heme-degrading monooxygenase HmoA